MHPDRLRITGRSTSHFTRAAIMFAHDLGVGFDVEVVRDLTSLVAADFGGHPALKLPTLHVGDEPVYGTENICRALADAAGRAHDPRVVLPEHLSARLARNAQEIVWTAMIAQVQLAVGMLTKAPLDHVFFVKARAGLEGALLFLDRHFDAVLGHLPPERDVSVFETTTFCLLEHIAFRPAVDLGAFERLRRFVGDYHARPSAQKTPYRIDPAAVVFGGAP